MAVQSPPDRTSDFSCAGLTEAPEFPAEPHPRSRIRALALVCSGIPQARRPLVAEKKQGDIIGLGCASGELFDSC